MNDATAKPRILAVDDSRVMRKAMNKVLGAEYDVIEAEHGEDAWTILTNDSEIQIVFTDLSMPYLDGFGLLERIRTAEDERLQDMPVIIITGKEDNEETKQKALNKGASDFITKPFDSVQLKARAKTHIRLEQTNQKLSETSQKLERQAAIDELTGLGGRRYFCKAGDETLSYVKRHGGQFILWRMDIDDFNTLFIANGKSLADTILQQVGDVLARLVRKEDMIARIGLAKFAMLLKDTDMNNALQLSKRINKELNKLEFVAGEHTLHITVSTGLLEPKILADASFEELTADAEKYMQKAVEAGGNQIAVKSLRKDHLRKYVDITTALKLIAEGNTAYLENHVLTLSQQLLPLLDFLAEHGEAALSTPLAELKQQLAASSEAKAPQANDEDTDS